MALPTYRVHRTLARVGAAAAMLALTGCFAMVAGVHQDMQFRSDIPNLDVHMDGKSCRVPCALTIRRQWGTFHMQAIQNDEVVSEGPISRCQEYTTHDCDSTRDNFALLMAAAFTDGLLIIPGIVDISTGIVVWHPETVVIQPGAYQLEDRCFDQPVQRTSQKSDD